MKKKWLGLGISGLLVSMNLNGVTDDPLISVLEKAATYCERIKSATFSFACEESIHEESYFPFKGWKVNRNIYIRIGGSEARDQAVIRSWKFLYQMDQRRGVLDEARYTLGKNGLANERIKTLPALNFFSFRFVTLGPVGLLSRANQALFDYQYLGREILFDRSCLVIKATPRSETRQVLYGSAWVDEESGAILRISWAPESMQDYEIILNKAKEIKGEPRLEMVSEYDQEVQGIHFPSRFLIFEGYSANWHPTLLCSELVVEYSDYRFFDIIVSEKLYSPERNH